MATTTFPDSVRIQGNLEVVGSMPSYARTGLTQENNARFKLLPTDWRVWDAMQTNLPGTSATDDLALVGGTFGTAAPSIQTSDMKALGSVTRKARMSVRLPHTYVAGQSVTIRAKCGMITTVADVAATIDFSAYRAGDDLTIGSDLVTTAAQSINSLTYADKDFVLDAATLAPGDTIDIQMSVLVNDAATATAVIACVGGVELLLDVKG